jgi:hypothetical protein
MIKIIKRSKYLVYYFKKLDYTNFWILFKSIKANHNFSSLGLWSDILVSSYKYNIGLMDYFIFSFYNKSKLERSKWVGTGMKYEFDLKMNPQNTRYILENKLEFYKAYEPFIKHKFCSISDIKNQLENANQVFDNPSGKIVIKNSKGQCGWDVEVVNQSDFTLTTLFDYMSSKKFDLAEEFVQQHPEIQTLSSSGLNTVRFMTMVNNDGGVDFLGARMRISVNSHVDNLASGNIACPIDLDSGKISGPGVYSDIRKDPVTHHPISGVPLICFQIPMWNDILEVVHKIALHRPENRGIGWDIAITENGPDFIEGNHNWCKILWQLPVNRGLKSDLEKYTG